MYQDMMHLETTDNLKFFQNAPALPSSTQRPLESGDAEERQNGEGASPPSTDCTWRLFLSGWGCPLFRILLHMSFLSSMAVCWGRCFEFTTGDSDCKIPLRIWPYALNSSLCSCLVTQVLKKLYS